MNFSLKRNFVLIHLIQYIAHYRVSKVIRKHTKLNPIQAGGESAAPPPLRFFLHNSKLPWDIEKKLSDFDFTPLMVILHILPITILIRGCHSNLLFTVCHVILAIEKNKKNLNYFKDNYLIKLKFLGPEFKFIKIFNVWRHFDVTMAKRQNTHISETEKVYCVIMTSFFNQNTGNFAQALFIRLYLPIQNLV